jgi:hypothetical protein
MVCCLAILYVLFFVQHICENCLSVIGLREEPRLKNYNLFFLGSFNFELTFHTYTEIITNSLFMFIF